MFKKIFTFAFLLALVASIPGVVDLTDDNFDKLVKADQGLWLVFFSADWCGHCQHLKPQIEKLAPKLNSLGVLVGHVGEKNSRLINDYVVDHTTHMVSYPKLKVFLGSQVLSDVPPGLRNSELLLNWFKKQYNLQENEEL